MGPRGVGGAERGGRGGQGDRTASLRTRAESGTVRRQVGGGAFSPAYEPGSSVGDRGRHGWGSGADSGAGAVRAWRRGADRAGAADPDRRPRATVVRWQSSRRARPRPTIRGTVGPSAGPPARVRSAGRWRDPQASAGLEAVSRPGVPGLDGPQGHPEVVGDAVQVVARADHVDVAGGRARARLEQRVAARGRLGRRFGGRCRGRWPDSVWGSATRSGSAWGSGSRPASGSGSGTAVAAAVAVASGVAAADVAVGAAVSTSPRTAPVGPAGAAAVRVRPPLATTNATDRRKAPIRARTDPAIAGVTIRGAGTRSSGLAGGHRAAHVARAVDVSAGQADELLLAQRLGHRPAEGRASVRLVRRLDGDAEAIAIVDRAEERADPLVRRGLVDGPATQGVGRPRGRPGIVHPDGMGLLGRRRIVLHARSSLPPGLQRRGV